MEKKKVYSSLSILFLNLFILCIILFASSYFSILVLDIIVNPNIIFAFGFLFLFLTFIFWDKSKETIIKVKKDKDNLVWKVIPYLFLLCLAIIALNQYFKWEFVKSQLLRFVILSITFGALTFWHNRDKFETEIENDKKKEEKDEEKRKLGFASKFPRINKIPIFRSLVKWMYKEGWFYSCALMAIFIIGILLRIPKLDFPIQTLHDVYAASWILKNAIPLADSGVIYWRVFPFTYILALFLQISNFLGINSDLFLKIPVSLFSIGTLFIVYLISKNLELSKKYIITIMLIASLSTWSLAYAHYVRFFSMLIFLIYLGVYLLIKYQKTNKISYLFLFLGTYLTAIFIEKPALVLLGLFIAYIIGIIYDKKGFSKKVISLIAILAILTIFSFISFQLSKPIVPEKFSSQNEIISETKLGIFTNLSFNNYNIELINKWYFPLNILAFLSLVLIFNKNIFKPSNFLFWFTIALLVLSFLGVSKNTPRNISFYCESFSILLGIAAVSFNKLVKPKILSFLIILFIIIKISSGISFFIMPISSGDLIPEGAPRISEADTFILVHDLTLSSDFVKDYMKNNTDFKIVSTHSAAWENIYLAPYRIDYILNDIVPEELTAVKIENKTFSLYEGIEIINGTKFKELIKTNKVILVTNYDYKYRLKKDTRSFIESYNPIFVSSKDERVKVYEFKN